MKYKQLDEINRKVNTNSVYKKDIENYKVPEYWTLNQYYKDCEDYALTKQHLILQTGFPLELACITCCFTETGEYHAVLYVELDKGSYILDNRYDDLMNPKELPYTWDKMWRGNKWYKINGF